MGVPFKGRLTLMTANVGLGWKRLALTKTGRHDIQHDDTKHNDIQHDGTT